MYMYSLPFRQERELHDSLADLLGAPRAAHRPHYIYIYIYMYIYIYIERERFETIIVFLLRLIPQPCPIVYRICK